MYLSLRGNFRLHLLSGKHHNISLHLGFIFFYFLYFFFTIYKLAAEVTLNKLIALEIPAE